MAPATSVSISFKEEPLHTPREKMVQTENRRRKIEKKKTSTFVHVTEQGPRATLKPGPRTLSRGRNTHRLEGLDKNVRNIVCASVGQGARIQKQPPGQRGYRIHYTQPQVGTEW